MRGVLVCGLAFVLMSGCSSPPADQARPGDGAGLNDATHPVEAPPSHHWQAQAFSGDFTTTTSLDLEGFAFGHDTLTVPEGALHGWFNGTVSLLVPDDVDVRFIPPGCMSQSCYVEGPLDDPSFALDTGDGPAPGEWGIVFFARTAAQSGSYRIEVNVLLSG